MDQRSQCKSKNYKTLRKKIIANHLSDKGLVSRIYNELVQLNNKVTDNSNKKWAKDLSRYFLKKTQQMKRYLMSLAMREIQIKTTNSQPLG